MPALRPDSRAVAGAWLAAVVIAVCLPVGLFADAQTMPESVVDVRIEGHETVPASWILNEIQTQPNRPLSSRTVREDKRSLMKSRLFYSVEERYEQGPQGTVLVFRVHERPIVKSVRFVGNDKIKEKKLVSWTGLRKGVPYDPVANREAERRIEREYKELGFYFAKVKLQKGSHPDDREVVIGIHEGPKVRVFRRDFKGVDELNAGRLKTKLVTKPAFLGMFKGIYRPETLEQDSAAIKEYCRGLGYFDATVRPEPLWSDDKSRIRIVYHIHEGPRSKIRNIEMEGNRIFSTEQLRKDARVNEGDYFNANLMNKDVKDMLTPYWDRGHFNPAIQTEPRFTEQPGVVDLVFHVSEDRPRFIRNIDVSFDGDYPYTKETVVRTRFEMEPGDKADPRKLARAQSRLQGSGLFDGVQINPTPIDPEMEMFAPVSDGRTFRGQQPITGPQAPDNWTQELSPIGRASHDSPERLPRPERTQPAVDRGVNSDVPNAMPGMSFRSPPTAAVPASDVGYQAIPPSVVFQERSAALLKPDFPDTEAPVIRAQNGSPFYPGGVPERGNAALEGSPYNNQFQPVQPGWVDIDASVQEGRTGRIMFGAGVNSDAGIVGSFVWEERSFDIYNPPRSWADVISGRAFRGGGQRFRVEAAPGDQVSRYSISWTDPYFMYSDYILSLSGFYYNRYMPDWKEDRYGGRIGIGKQLTPEWTVNTALRLEDVEISRPNGVPPPPVLLKEVGNNFLSTVEFSLSHDTRDTSIMPTEGHRAQLSYEQAFGDYTYPKFGAEGRQYFTLFSRPDDSGRQVLMVGANVGFSTDDLPVFERYYLGGFQSFRGFAYRGVSPRLAGVGIGGTFQAVATAEYRIPVTADDMIHFVTFADVGTADTSVSFDRVRATVGVGLRVVIPAMGQVPLAFDFGFPVAKEAFDDERIFSFYVGTNF